MLEVEVKIKIRDENEVRRKLIELGARPKFHLHHIDKYFDKNPPNPSFARSDEALRLRISEETPIAEESSTLNSQETIKKIDLTYKGPKEPGVVKTRKEIICKLDESEAMEQILTSVGFFLRCTVEKHRDVFDVQYSPLIQAKNTISDHPNHHESENISKVPIEVLIDHVDGLPGAYLEAEIMVPGTREDYSKTHTVVEDKDQATEILLEFLGELGYSGSDSIRESYLELVLKKY